jgi:hypothetical protein
VRFGADWRFCWRKVAGKMYPSVNVLKRHSSKHMKRALLVAGLTMLLTSDLFPGPQIIGDSVAEGSEFVFARLVYGSGIQGYFRRGGSWRTDWPKADKQFMFGIERLSNVRIVLDKDVAVPIMDPSLFTYPFVYAVEVGHMVLSPPEAERLREYMLRGGFLVVDDFWGTYEWDSFYAQARKIFPDKEVEQIPLSHEIFSAFYDIEKIIQVPNVNNGCRGSRTHERDGRVPYALAVFDDLRRPMMVINYNTDIGDAWEWADQPCYPHEFSGFAYRMGLNFIIYSMTH